MSYKVFFLPQIKFDAAKIVQMSVVFLACESDCFINLRKRLHLNELSYRKVFLCIKLFFVYLFKRIR